MSYNEYGLDVSYFSSWLERLDDISRYKPSELARELARMSRAADDKVILEDEFAGKHITELQQQNTELMASNERLLKAGNALSHDLQQWQASEYDEDSVQVNLDWQLVASQEPQTSLADLEIDSIKRFRASVMNVEMSQFAQRFGAECDKYIDQLRNQSKE